MSDDDDEFLEDDILCDIKALEQVLAHELHDSEDDHDNEDPLGNNVPIEKINTPTSTLRNESEEFYDTVNSVIKANERLLEVYKSALDVVDKRLDECIKRQQEVDYEMSLISRGGKANWRVPYFKAGQPYFKDENLFGATPNHDQIMKMKRDEIAIVYSRSPSKWSHRGRMNLWKAARANASTKYLELMKSLNRKNETASEIKHIVPTDFVHILKTLGDTELDWLKISVQDMKSRHTWQACKAMWDLHMKPTNNREKWSNAEDNKLISLAKLYKYQNWDLIANELGTKRTCYQCFVRYNTINPESNGNTDAPWSPIEDQLINEIIEKLRIGDLIPWTLVTFYLGTKTKNQIYCHWKYHLDPSLKKGRFTAEEDQTLLNAVSKYDTNFSRIASKYFPHRTTVQLNNRFRLLMLKTDESYNSWTIADDKRLLALYDEFGNNWSVIGNLMNKDRTYVRHRHAAIARRLSKGVKLVHFPRKTPKSNDNNINDDDDNDDDDDIDMKMSENIDVQLMRYFHSAHVPLSTPPGRKRKYHTAEQLETKTKQIRKVFEKLDVNIIIPDNLDDFEELTPLDIQLLTSLKKSYELNLPRYTPDQIEEYRLKMFRTNKLDDDTEQFIPPAPFGLFQNVRKKSNSRKVNKDTVSADCNLKLQMEFDTPDNVIKMMNDDELKIFDKFTLLITQTCKIAQYPGRFLEMYVTPLKQTRETPCADLFLQPGTSYEGQTGDDLINEMPNTFIEPCYSTLLGYQWLLNLQKMFDTSVTNDILMNQRVTNKDVKEAFYLLKNRLITLFKYPIGLARIPLDHKQESTINKEDILVEERNIPVTMQEFTEMSTSEYEMEIDDPKLDIEVSTPVRFSLNDMKKMRQKFKNRKDNTSLSSNEL